MHHTEHVCFEFKFSNRNYPFPRCTHNIKHREIAKGVGFLVDKTSKNPIEFKRLTPEWAYQVRMNPDKDCDYWIKCTWWQSFKIKWDDNLLIKTLKEGYWVNALIGGLFIILFIAMIIVFIKY